MHVDWDDLRIFLAMTTEDNISRTAEKLKVDPSTVTRHLDHLEGRMGVTLLIRDRGSYQLTGAGKIVLAAAQQMSEEAQGLEWKLIGVADRAESGDVTVAAADFIVAHLLLPGLGRFMADHPDISLTLKATNHVLDIGNRDTDIAVRFTNNLSDLRGNLHGRQVGRLELCAYKGKQSEDRNLSWVAWNRAEFEAWIGSNGYPAFPRRCVTNSVPTQLEAIKRCDLAAVLPCFLGDSDASVERIEGCKSFEGFDVWVVTHRDMKGMKRIEATMQYVTRALASQKRNLTAG